MPSNTNLPQNLTAPQESLPAHWPSVRLHLRIGWWMLLTFVTLGVVLEAMHGFKIDLYLNVERASTRVLWTLTHAIGAILGLVHIAFAASLFISADGTANTVALASACLKCASILVPAAFLIAGALASERGVALGFVLAIPGILFFLLGLLLTAMGMDFRPRNRT